MGWSLPLGRIAGTDVRVHITFFLLLAWYGISAGIAGGQEAALGSVAFLIAVFACVLAHEFGHVLMARRFGIRTRDVTLLPIGGLASMERMPSSSGQELLVALAGPAVNVAIALLLVAGLGVSVNAVDLTALQIWDMQSFLQRLAIVNIMLVLFNLLPAFPMDGGRVLRALLAMALPRAKATRIAATIGQVLAFGLGFLGLFGNPLLLLVAFFVFMAAGQEAYAVELDEATRQSPTRSATITAFESLGVQATVARAVELLLATSQREFPVVDGTGALRGVLTRDGIIKALAQGGPDTPVTEVMERDVPAISSQAPLPEAIRLLNESARSLIGVHDRDGRISGILTQENVAEYMLVTQAGQSWRARRS
jgi:stage IV sporulation protein FB